MSEEMSPSASTILLTIRQIEWSVKSVTIRVEMQHAISDRRLAYRFFLEFKVSVICRSRDLLFA